MADGHVVILERDPELLRHRSESVQPLGRVLDGADALIGETQKADECGHGVSLESVRVLPEYCLPKAPMLVALLREFRYIAWRGEVQLGPVSARFRCAERKYMSVRRLKVYIEETIRSGTKWARGVESAGRLQQFASSAPSRRSCS